MTKQKKHAGVLALIAAAGLAMPVYAQEVAVGALMAPGAVATTPLISMGEKIFLETAGDIGCAYCHGVTAAGDPELNAPPIANMPVETIENALFRVEIMSFITLTKEEVEAVAAYLHHLDELNKH